MSLEKDVDEIRKLSEGQEELYKKTPIIKADWDCEVVPAAQGGYGYTLIIYKNGEPIHRQAGYGSIQGAQWSARDFVLQEEFGMDYDFKRDDE